MRCAAHKRGSPPARTREVPGIESDKPHSARRDHATKEAVRLLMQLNARHLQAKGKTATWAKRDSGSLAGAPKARPHLAAAVGLEWQQIENRCG